MKHLPEREACWGEQSNSEAMAKRGTREVSRASHAILGAYRGGPKLAVNELSQVDFVQPPTRIEDACARFDGRTSAAEAPQQKDREGRLTSRKCAC